MTNEEQLKRIKNKSKNRVIDAVALGSRSIALQRNQVRLKSSTFVVLFLLLDHFGTLVSLPAFFRMEVFRLLFNRCFRGSKTGASVNKNKAMVESLQHNGVITSSKVAEVMEAIDRGLFVESGTQAYVDSPMQIGYNATISAPHMHATCLELLEQHLQPGMRVLDVGSGTGYLTACFAIMVGPHGHVVGVEHIPELVSFSIENIRKSAASSLLKEGSLEVHIADGRLGWPELAPYDAIHVGQQLLKSPNH
ncbi:hypothetical protein HPP92_003368 [Vanilla planifolia]|uniref:Protein-L-isoaspartate O-methyltransferase n=1 Tax=Vanilla planifolia TaxID=51239 RepID=A0A835SBP5_VANPL|nr:hypothetical protein HPP92_003368 [Vanilla planifolia]